jgi:hypothetical protein
MANGAKRCQGPGTVKGEPDKEGLRNRSDQPWTISANGGQSWAVKEIMQILFGVFAYGNHTTRRGPCAQ